MNITNPKPKSSAAQNKREMCDKINLNKLFFTTIAACLIGGTIFAIEPKAGTSIAVSPVSLNNPTSADNFIPLMFQSQLATDFQNYSWFSVIDRSSVEAVSNEQQIAEMHSASIKRRSGNQLCRNGSR